MKTINCIAANLTWQKLVMVQLKLVTALHFLIESYREIVVEINNTEVLLAKKEDIFKSEISNTCNYLKLVMVGSYEYGIILKENYEMFK